MNRFRITRHIVITSILCSFSIANAWHDQTHLAVSQVAGYDRWYNSAAADIAKGKARSVEEYNHWYNNNSRTEITAEIVLNQAVRYNDDRDPEGHLLGAIIGSLREYEASKASRKYADYNIAFCAHYIGDLTQPLHNIPYGDFNKSHHLANDGTVEKNALAKSNLKKIHDHTYPISLRSENFESDLAKEIARIANITRLLGYKLEKENRNMTEAEAYVQLGHSASLLKAVLTSIYKVM